jgi:hypothetical protein
MAQAPHSASACHELSRPHNPWEKFTQRDEKKHVADDVSRLCPPASITSDVIKLFLTHGMHPLDEAVPRQRQLLKEFLNAVMISASASSVTYLDDVQDRSTIVDIALLDDRNKHIGCVKMTAQQCVGCHIFSKNLTIPEFCMRLRDAVGHIVLNSAINSD